jgi:alcohol dehydrogenase
MDALTHAVESYLSVRANPWSAGIALRVIAMVAEYLPRACADGADREARAQMLLAAHMAGIAMATTGLGACHAIGHSLGGRFDIPHGIALTMVLPQVLSFSRPACEDRLADVAVALGAADGTATPARNAAAAIEAIADLAAAIGMTHTTGDFGVTRADLAQIVADALDDEVLVNAPLQPSAADVTAILEAARREPTGDPA